MSSIAERTTVVTKDSGRVKVTSRVTPYAKLPTLDRNAALTLTAYCKTRSDNSPIAAKLANTAVLQTFLTSLPLVLSDTVTFVCCFLASLLLVSATLAPEIATLAFAGSISSLCLIPIARLSGLYPGIGLGSIVEFRQTCRVVMAGSLIMGGVLIYSNVASWAAIFVTCVLTGFFGIPSLVSSRFITRKLVTRWSWWGIPTAIIGEPGPGLELFHRLQKEQELGFRPIGVLVESEDYWATANESTVPIYDVKTADSFASENSITCALISQGSGGDITSTLDRALAVIPNRVLLAYEQLDMGIWDELLCVGAATGLRLSSSRPTLLHKWVKRTLDVAAAATALLLGFPFLATIALLIKLTSKGPVLYGQQRIGLGGQHFTAWKFRTMQSDADKVLDSFLEKNPKANREWQETHKLKNDPRVTWIGKFLRATSLDELPQLWNILVGEMSVVGPRPIIDSPTYDATYVRVYPDEYQLYKSVRPGLTGLWQVRCRNSGVYELRIYWDMYYIRNWSIWLDCYLIMRTVRTVLLREGGH